MTKSQINRLGERLRKPGPPADEDHAELQQLRATYRAPMTEVQAVLKRKLGLLPAARIKTINTIIEKLRRETTRLSQMQDIAGLRVTQEMLLTEQDRMTKRVIGEFSSARIIDRRATPSFGYRAVHVIVSVHGLPVEIQIRTQWKNLWAQAMESLADRIGREVRYGEAQTGAMPEVVKLHEISRRIAGIEKALDDIAELQRGSLRAFHAAANQRELRLKEMQLKTRAGWIQEAVENDAKTLRAELATMIQSWK